VTRSRTHSRAHGDNGVTDAQTSPFGSGLTHIFLCTDDHGQSFVRRLHQDPPDRYTNNHAMDFLKAEIARLFADPPPYEDRLNRPGFHRDSGRFKSCAGQALERVE
jgi:hypothetical protein